MVGVSDKFIELAQQNGRQVWCKIIADGVEFLDDRIIDMDFDDVVHPDWFTVGTTCANRLHFTAVYSGELSSGAEVRAYISFDGAEWCPLGVFYIARRYIRGNRVSITAYDKMYDLDIDYYYNGEIPVNSQELLRQVCVAAGLECDDYGMSFTVESVPDGCTVRDMLGYFAGINCACARISRDGKFVMKRSGNEVMSVSDKNCWSVQRNMGMSGITSVKINTGDGEITKGSGAEISMLEMYNPFATPAIAETIYRMIRPFGFYGAELEMQGMPFLEAGEMIGLLDGNMLYPLIISEVEYHYDGGLSAVLYSRNRVNDEESGDLEKLLEQLLHNKNAVFYRSINQKQIAVNPQPQIIADFEFESTEDCFAQLDVNFTIKQSTADQLILMININGADVPRNIIQTMGNNDFELLHVCHLAEKLSSGKNRIYVTARTKSGEAYIPKGDMAATLVGHGIYGNSGSQRDKVSLYEKADRWQVMIPAVSLNGLDVYLNKEEN